MKQKRFLPVIRRDTPAAALSRISFSARWSLLSVFTVIVIKYADYSQKDDVLSLRL